MAITGLEEWGAAKVSERMQRDMNADQALLFSETLRRTADQLLRRHPKLKDEMERLRRMCPDAKQHDWYGRYLREGEIVTIRTTADWYEQIGRLGFGVQIVDG